MQLDLVIRNAAIRTMDPARPAAGQIGVWHGRVVGLDAEIEGDTAHRVIDLGGATLVPGFIDAHTHLVFQGLGLGAIDLTPAQSVEQALAIIDAALADATGDWVDISGYDQRRLGRHLTATDLDAVSRGRPVALTHISGHATVVNSAVLAALSPAAIKSGDPNVGRDAAGQPNGLFLEMTQHLVRQLRPPHTVEELRQALRRSTSLCAMQGVTFCAEAGIGGGLIRHSPIEAAAYQQLAQAAVLPVRVQLMVTGDFLRPLGAPPADHTDLGIDLGLRTGFGGGRLSLGAIKLWLDGGMSSRTAALSEPYVGSPGCGDLTPEVEAYREIAATAHAAGWQLALHAIGDRAVDLALDFIEGAQARHSRVDARPRIEHCGLVRPDQLARIAAAGVTAVIQPDFLFDFGDDYSAILGSERTPWMYRGRSFLDHGIRIAGSSDRPVTAGAPLSAMRFMVDRRSRTGRIIGPDEAITAGEALRAYTIDAAWACGVDAELGSLQRGKLADFTILDGDPCSVAPTELANLAVIATVVGGMPTHDPTGLWTHGP